MIGRIKKFHNILLKYNEHSGARLLYSRMWKDGLNADSTRMEEKLFLTLESMTAKTKEQANGFIKHHCFKICYPGEKRKI